jgi:hypothetical protein
MADYFRERLHNELMRLLPGYSSDELHLAATYATARVCELLLRHNPGFIVRMRLREAAHDHGALTHGGTLALLATAPRTWRALRHLGYL